MVMGPPRVSVDCAAMTGADLGDLDALARLFLGLRRAGCDPRLTNVGADLADLIRFAGLAGTLAVEAGRQAEEREQLGCVEEEGDLGEPSL
jgi:hypothetical protein